MGDVLLAGDNAASTNPIDPEVAATERELDLRQPEYLDLSLDRKEIVAIGAFGGITTFVANDEIVFQIKAIDTLDVSESYLLLPCPALTGGATNAAFDQHIESIIDSVQFKSLQSSEFENIEAFAGYTKIMASLLWTRDFANSQAGKMAGYGTRAQREVWATQTTTYALNLWQSGFWHMIKSFAAKYIAAQGQVAIEVRFKLASNVRATVASAGSPVYSVVKPLLVLKRLQLDGEKLRPMLARYQSRGFDYEFDTPLHVQLLLESGDTSLKREIQIREENIRAIVGTFRLQSTQNSQTLPKWKAFFDANWLTAGNATLQLIYNDGVRKVPIDPMKFDNNAVEVMTNFLQVGSFIENVTKSNLLDDYLGEDFAFGFKLDAYENTPTGANSRRGGYLTLDWKGPAPGSNVVIDIWCICHRRVKAQQEQIRIIHEERPDIN